MGRRQPRREAANARGTLALINNDYPAVITAKKPNRTWHVLSREQHIKLLAELEPICNDRHPLRVERASDIVQRRRR